MDWESGGPRVWGPYAVTAGCAVAGVVLRLVSGPGAVVLAALVPAVAGLVVVVAHAIGRPVAGVDRAVEVTYVTGVLAALAGWTVAAGMMSWPSAAVLVVAVIGLCTGWLAYGPGQRVTGLAAGLGVAAAVLTWAALDPAGPGGVARWLSAWVAGTSVGAVPYWVHGRVRAANTPPKVAVDGLTAAIVKHLHAQITVVDRSLNVGAEGRYSLRYRLFDGKTAQSVQVIIPAVESELGLRPGAVMVEGSRHRRDEVTVSVTPVEPTVVSVMPALPTSITEPAPLGLHDNGDPMMVSICDETGTRGLLAAGRKGSGKSRAKWTLLKAWTHCLDALFVFIDLSGGATSNPWLPCLHWRVTTPEDGERVLDALLEEATARAAILADMGWESWRPSPDYPAIVVPIDEVQRLTKDNWAAKSKLDQLMQVDRKSGISCVLMCPNPTGIDGVSPATRENAAVRLCFASSGQAAKYVLGDTPAGPVSYVTAEFTEPGQVLGYGPGLAPVPGRAFDTDLAEAAKVAEEHAARRPPATGLLTAVLRSAGRDNPGEQPAQPQPGPAPVPPGPAADPAVVDRLRAMVAGPGVLGQPWPDLPTPPAEGRMGTQQALQVVAAMIRQPGGASPADIVAATGRSRSWVHGVLKEWADDDLACNTEHGRWEAVAATAA